MISQPLMNILGERNVVLPQHANSDCEVAHPLAHPLTPSRTPSHTLSHPLIHPRGCDTRRQQHPSGLERKGKMLPPLDPKPQLQPLNRTHLTHLAPPPTTPSPLCAQLMRPRLGGERPRPNARIFGLAMHVYLVSRCTYIWSRETTMQDYVRVRAGRIPRHQGTAPYGRACLTQSRSGTPRTRVTPAIWSRETKYTFIGQPPRLVTCPTEAHTEGL